MDEPDGPIAGPSGTTGSTPQPASTSASRVRPRSKWEDVDDEGPPGLSKKQQGKKVKRAVKTFSNTIQGMADSAASTPTATTGSHGYARAARTLTPSSFSALDSPSLDGVDGYPGRSRRVGLDDDDEGEDAVDSGGHSRWESNGKARRREGMAGKEADDTESAARRRKRSRRARMTAYHPVLQGCRSVYCYERLNHIEEGSYGVVSRARDKETGDIVALKKLKMDQEKNGFPITSLREIRTLMMVGHHDNIVRVREIVVGDTLTQIFIVMDFIEHDLKTLLATMRTPFLASEVKTLLQQLLSAIALCHDNWILHRDLKTSNLLMNNRGQIKVADFGLARTYGEPLGDMTQLVVTLWYRAPELLLGETEYSTAVDMWSIGCIFGELLQTQPLFPGKGEIDQLSRIFKLLGRPSEDVWPGFNKLPNARSLNLGNVQPYSSLRAHFKYTTELGVDLLQRLLTYDPARRISAEEALRHPWFSESPLPKHPDMFQSFPSIAAGERKRYASPSAPARGGGGGGYGGRMDDGYPAKGPNQQQQYELIL